MVATIPYAYMNKVQVTSPLVETNEFTLNDKTITTISDEKTGADLDIPTRKGSNAIVNAIYCNNVDTLRNTHPDPFERVNLMGYHVIGDGGQGDFYWDSESTETDDKGTIFKVTDITTGRWKRIYTGAVHVEWYTSFEDCLTAMSSDEVTVKTSTPIDLDGASVTVLLNIHLKCNKGTMFSNGTLTINGGFECGNYQVFNTNLVVNGLKETSIEIFSAIGSTDDSIAFQRAINATIVGGKVKLSSKSYSLSNVSISKRITIEGVANTPEATYLNILGTSNTGFIVTESNSRFKNFTIIGISNTTEKGSDNTQTGFDLSDSAGDVDSLFENITMQYLYKCITFSGRNLELINAHFSNSHYGIHIPNNSVADVRGLHITHSRFHSMTKTGTNASSIYIDPTANFKDVVINNIYVDDCELFMGGFAGNVQLAGVCTRARGEFVNVDATTSTISQLYRTFSINLPIYEQATPTTGSANSAIYVKGLAFYRIFNTSIKNTAGHGVVLDSTSDYELDNVSISNVGQLTTNTYACFKILANTIRGSIKNCTAQQDVGAVIANKAKYGFDILVGGAQLSGNSTKGTFGTSAVHRIGDITNLVMQSNSKSGRFNTDGSVLYTNGLSCVRNSAGDYTITITNNNNNTNYTPVAITLTTNRCCIGTIIDGTTFKINTFTISTQVATDSSFSVMIMLDD